MRSSRRALLSSNVERAAELERSLINRGILRSYAVAGVVPPSERNDHAAEQARYHDRTITVSLLLVAALVVLVIVRATRRRPIARFDAPRVLACGRRLR